MARGETRDKVGGGGRVGNIALYLGGRCSTVHKHYTPGLLRISLVGRFFAFY